MSATAEQVTSIVEKELIPVVAGDLNKIAAAKNKMDAPYKESCSAPGMLRKASVPTSTPTVQAGGCGARRRICAKVESSRGVLRRGHELRVDHCARCVGSSRDLVLLMRQHLACCGCQADARCDRDATCATSVRTLGAGVRLARCSVDVRDPITSPRDDAPRSRGDRARAGQGAEPATARHGRGARDARARRGTALGVRRTLDR